MKSAAEDPRNNVNLVICLLFVNSRKSLSFAKRLRQKWEWERERGGGGRGSGRGHERRARKRTGWKVHVESKTQVCWLTSVLAIDVHENALTPQDTSVLRIHPSSARLEKSDAWPASGHSFYDEPWTPAHCHVRVLTWAPTASISARQSHLLHLQSPLFGYVPRSGGENVKETTSPTSTRLPVVRVRRKRGGKRREEKGGVQRFVEKINGSNRSGLGRGQHQQLRSRSANIEKCSRRSAQQRKSSHLFVVCQFKKKFVVRQKASSEMGMREREGGGGGRGSGQGHERRARKRTGWKVHVESKTQVCWLTSVLAIDVHENALTPQDTSVLRIHPSSARLEKSDAWPASGHSFYDEPWTPAHCHVRALTWAPTASISARQSHLLHLQSPLFGYVPRSGGENVKETTSTNQHTSPGGEGKEEEGREEKRGEGRGYSVLLRR